MSGESDFPAPFVSRLTRQIGYESANLLLRSLEEDPAVSIRFNPSKKISGFNLNDPVPWSSNGFFLSERPSFTLDPHFHAGAYYVQESSSMFLEEVFRQVVSPSVNLKILDMCGAPGGKSTHLASVSGPGSLVVANEVVRQRVSILSENISKWGTDNVVVTSNDPARFSQLPGFFDILVVDAPCSGEGMFRKNEVVNEWSLSNTRLCSQRQKRILADSWDALKEGGLLIYSTCTFNPEENEKNIEWLQGIKGVESIRLDLIPDWGIEEIKYKGIFGYGFYPGRVRGEGFYISVCRKTGESLYNSHVPGRLKHSISVDDRSFAADYTRCDQGRLFRLNDLLIYGASHPGTISFLRSRLNVVKAGTAIATVKGSSYIPNHELALSVILRRESFPTIRVNHSEALAYLGRQTLGLKPEAPGWNLVDYEGSMLGFVKNIGSRLNNYYPQEWRIRMQT